jgi:hypothetical protein
MARKTRKLRKQRKQRKTRKQSGGYYPSVFEGIRNASVLFPVVMRQAYNLWNTRKTKKNK